MGGGARKGRPYQYIIMLTVKGEKENVVAGLDAGADDYVTKPFDSQELQMRIKVGERILLLQEQLRKAALYDSLTGLPNRRAVIDGLGGKSPVPRGPGNLLPSPFLTSIISRRSTTAMVMRRAIQSLRGGPADPVGGEKL